MARTKSTNAPKWSGGKQRIDSRRSNRKHLSCGVCILLVLCIRALGKSVACEPAEFEDCAPEGEYCVCSGTVRFGTEDMYVEQYVQNGTVLCINQTFGDPAPGFDKYCLCRTEGNKCVQYATVNKQDPFAPVTSGEVPLWHATQTYAGNVNHIEKEEDLAFDLIIDEPEADSHLFLQNPDLQMTSVNFLVYFRIASPRSGAGYGRGPGQCCRQMIARMLLFNLQMPQHLIQESSYFWNTSVPITVCTNVATVTSLVDAQANTQWGPGRNILELELYDPFDMRLLASNSSTFNIHFTDGVDYRVLHRLSNQDLFEAATLASQEVSSLVSNTILIPISFHVNVSNENYLKMISKNDYGLTKVPKLTVYVLFDPNSDDEDQDMKFDTANSLFSRLSFSRFNVSLRPLRADLPLIHWAGR